MAELDFFKIFGETATSKASFTDENYLNGWGYLGSTPPPYQLFDYLQSINDKKSKYLYDKMLENGNNLSIHNTDEQAHQPILDLINTNQTELNNKIDLHSTDETAHNDIRNTVPRISIITGTCLDGETIPLPDGYTETQCKIFVSMSIENPNGYWYDPAEGGARNMLKVECYTEGRILRCAMVYNGFDSWKTGRDSGSIVNSRIACVANYMVIGIKYGG